jgi:hypothetical protein
MFSSAVDLYQYQPGLVGLAVIQFIVGSPLAPSNIQGRAALIAAVVTIMMAPVSIEPTTVRMSGPLSAQRQRAKVG